MDSVLSFFLGVAVTVVLFVIGILVTLKIRRSQKREAKENTALLQTDHQKILKNQERQERIQKRVMVFYHEILRDEYGDVSLPGDTQAVLENTASATAETIANLSADVVDKINLSEDVQVEFSEDTEPEETEDEENEDLPQDED